MIVFRPVRFTQVDDIFEVQQSPLYKWKTGDLVFADKSQTGVISSNVYKYNGTNFELLRYDDHRSNNNDFDSVTVYDYDRQLQVGFFEVFDPIKGIIPGVADREIDQKSKVDFAIYNTSTDFNYDTDERGAWGEDQVGRVWWDTSTVKYYDYEQGTFEYNADYWGKQVTGSKIDIYEWTKSTVPPEQWASAVKNQSEIFGEIASGSAYAVYDKPTDTYNYYYSELMEYNNDFQRYDTVYYFWVKNKNTVSVTGRNLPTVEIANIINNPTANGINWCAAISSSVFIVNNVTLNLSSDSLVLQVNPKPLGLRHESWTSISEGKDLIPDYWYIGLEDNLIGWQRETYNSLPNPVIHEYNRYGDNRSFIHNGVTRAQGWFKDVWSARREAISIINRLLRTANLLDDLTAEWGRIVNNIWITELGARYDMRATWDWFDYTHPDYDPFVHETLSLQQRSELNDVDTSLHTYVRVLIEEEEDSIDRDEWWLWKNNDWHLMRRQNGTIQFNDLVWNKNNLVGWDTRGWGGIWDFDPAPYMGLIIRACREDLFIKKYIENFNHLFVGMLKYTASIHDQVDWFYKTTYVRVDVNEKIDLTEPRHYKKDYNDTLDDYISTVKPYHTKVRHMFNNYNVHEDIDLKLSDSHNFDIEIKYESFNDNMLTNVDEIVSSFTDSEIEVYNEDITSPEFTALFNTSDSVNDRRNNFDIEFIEHLALKTITNSSGSTVDNSTRTHVYLQTNDLRLIVASLQESNMSTVVNTIDRNDLLVEVNDGSAFRDTGGIAYANGELFEYTQTIGNLIYIGNRGIQGTMPKAFNSGTQIIDVTDSFISMPDRLYEFGGNKSNIRYEQERLQLEASSRGVS
jgi:hypothetical protein